MRKPHRTQHANESAFWFRDAHALTTCAALPLRSDGVVCATGVRPALDPTGPARVDFLGTKNLVNAAAAVGAGASAGGASSAGGGVKHFVLITSIGTDDFFFPLNLAWGVLSFKKLGEEGAPK